MGYRSEVQFVIQKKRNWAWRQDLDTSPEECEEKTQKEDEAWCLYLAELATKPETAVAWKTITNENYSEWEYKGGLDRENCCIWIYFSSVKWYDGDETADSFKAMFDLIEHYNAINKQQEVIDAVYIRIGDERDDTDYEYLGDGYDLAEPVTYIEDRGESRFNHKLYEEK
jgi:hypothetical protein